MINSTILSLSAILLTNAPLSFPRLYQYKSFSVDRSTFTKSLSKLFYFNLFEGKVDFSTTKFENIIGGAIKIESETDFENQTIEKRFAPNIMYSNDYFFTSCMFRNCSSNGLNGGAISINIPVSKDIDVNILLQSCSFYNCFTQKGLGGALYGYLIQNVTIYETCFSRCFTMEQSSTGNSGTGTAVYIWHPLSKGTTECRFSSYDSCPETNIMYPNTETVFFHLYGWAIFKHSNFSNNFVESGSSAICLAEQNATKFEYSTCINCTGASTIHIIGQQSNSCVMNMLNFVNCNNHSEATTVYGIIVSLYSIVNIDKSVFIMKDNKFLSMRDPMDLGSHITFNECLFDRLQSDLYDKDIMDFNNCTFGKQPQTNTIEYFNSLECWEINPETPIPTITDLPSPTSDVSDHKMIKILTVTVIINSCLILIIILYLIIKCIYGKCKENLHGNSLSMYDQVLK